MFEQAELPDQVIEPVRKPHCGHHHEILLANLPEYGLRCPACFPKLFTDEISRLRRLVEEGINGAEDYAAMPIDEWAETMRLSLDNLTMVPKDRLSKHTWDPKGHKWGKSESGHVECDICGNWYAKTKNTVFLKPCKGPG
jgi:hypothetical protein